MQRALQIAAGAVSATTHRGSVEIPAREYFGLMALLARKIGDRELAQDIMHQAILESLRQLAEDRIVDRTRFIGYVYRVAMNLLRNNRRKIENRPELRLDSSIIDELAGIDSDSAEQMSADLARRVRAIIEELPTRRDREIARRFYLDEESKETLCRDLCVSPAHFDRIAFRMRRRMRALMESKGRDLHALLP
jgi:RNA polymerase sigma factor (sigma-70 family)